MLGDQDLAKMRHLIDHLLTSRLQELKESVIKEVLNKIKTVESECIKLQNGVKKLVKENSALEKKLDDVEQYTRRNNVRIFGL